MMEKQDISKGWIWAELGDLLDYEQPTNYIVESTEYSDEYKTPVLTAGKSFLLGYTKETTGIFNKIPVIIFDDFTTAIKFVTFPFKVKSSAMKILLPAHDEVNIKYVYYFMETMRLNVDTHKRYWISVGAIQPIPLPPLAEQHRIVAKIEELFSELDKGVEALKTAQQQLKVYRQAVLKYAFEGRLTNPDVKEGELPEGWVKRELKVLCQVNPKLPEGSYSDDLEVTFLPMKQIAEVVNKVDISEIRKYSQVKKGFTPMINGDVIFAKITPCMENGKIAIVEGLKNGIAFGSTEFHVFRCKKDVYNAYIFHFLVQEKTRRMAEENMTGAVGQRRVPKRFLEDLIVSMPSSTKDQKEVIRQIESRLSVCDKMEESIEQGLQQAEALRQSILKKAFEGKLVPQDPNDEPACQLLERIRAERANSVQLKKKSTKRSAK